jgi:hypothetical protein
VHVVRTNQPMFWLMIILMLQPLGGLVYLAAIVLPSMAGGRTARRLGQGAREVMDPTREYRDAQKACEDALTVHNQMRLAKAAAALGRHEEAQTVYGQATQGVHAGDPALLLGRAESLIELGRHDEALGLLATLEREADAGRAPWIDLALGRALEGLGRSSEADAAYRSAAGRVPGLEGLARYAAFQARSGRIDEARQSLVEIDRRLAGANPVFRKEGRHWRDLAARAVGAARP